MTYTLSNKSIFLEQDSLLLTVILKVNNYNSHEQEQYPWFVKAILDYVLENLYEVQRDLSQ